MARSKVLVALALVLAAAVAGYSSFPSPEDDAKSEIYPAKAPVDVGDAIGVPYVSQPDQTRPDLTIAAARRAAHAGSPEAMLDLSRALRLCAVLQVSDEQAIVGKQVQIAESYKRWAKDTGMPYDPKQQDAELESKARARLEVKRVCESISPADAGKWIGWLERAAATGGDDPKREFAQAVINSMSNPAEALADIDEIARRKKVAYRYLDEVLSHGDCMVSTHMELLAPTPIDSFTAAIVSFDWGRDLQPSLASPEVAAQNIAFMQQRLDEQASRLSASQIAQARSQAASAYQACTHR